MTDNTTNSSVGTDTLFIQLFDALPGKSVLLKNDEPTFTILAATPDYLKQTGYTKQAMIGKGVFEAFPTNHTDPTYTADTDLRASYERVVRLKQPHFLPVQRYDLKNEDGSFSERYWKASNAPVLNPEGEVAYIIHTAEDITDQVKIDELNVRIKGIEQAHHLFLQAPVVIGILRGEEHVIELINEEGLKFWGRPNVIIGKPLLEAIPELKDQDVYQKIDQVYKTGQLYQGTEIAITTINEGRQEVRYFDVYYKPYFEEGSTGVSGVFTVSNDVTEKVLANRRVEESERNLRNIILQAPVAMAILRGPRFIIEIANDYMYELWGRSKKELFGKSVFEGLPEVRDQGYEELLTNVYKTGKRFTALGIPVTLPRSSTIETVYINLLYEAFREADGTISGVMAVATDVTAQVKAKITIEESHKEFQFVTDFMPQIIWVTRPDGYHYYYNKQWYDYTGLSYGETEGEGWNKVFHPDDQQRAWTVWRNSLETGEPYQIEYRCRRYDGEYRWFLGRALPLKDEEGRVIKWFGTCTDIDDQKKVAAMMEGRIQERTKELRIANEELSRSNQNLEEFAYAASHDLKEPMRKIELFSGRLADQLGNRLDEEEKGYFNRIIKATHRMNTLIDDLLTYSHVSRGAELEERVDLNQKVSRVLEDLEVEIDENKAVIRVDALPTIKGHRRQLQQLFQNLIGNAIKYHKPGVPPEVHIGSRKLSAEESIPVSTARPLDQYHLIEVRDNGIGFEDEDADRIFNVFTRLHGNSEYKGTGVGLSIVRKVVENHGGYVWAESGPGKGAAFKVMLLCD